MNAEPTVCAASGRTERPGLDSSRAARNVRRLQARIVKATQEGRWNKVKALQRLLTHSHSGRVLAVKRVTENQGGRTPGVDREIWSDPETRLRAVLSLKSRGYRPKPLRRIYIPKKNGTLRSPPFPTGLASTELSRSGTTRPRLIPKASLPSQPTIGYCCGPETRCFPDGREVEERHRPQG